VRIVLGIFIWVLALVPVIAVFVVYANDQVSRHAKACMARAPGTTGNAGEGLAAARAFVACLDERSGWPERLMTYLDRKPITAPDPVPCRYVGEWKATRGRGVQYVTLNADGTFAVRAGAPDRAVAMTGAWIAEGRRIAWLSDSMLQFPFDSHRLRDVSDDGFTLVERDGRSTRYARISQNPNPKQGLITSCR